MSTSLRTRSITLRGDEGPIPSREDSAPPPLTEAITPQAAPPLNLPGFDVANTLNRVNGDSALLCKLLRSFATSNVDLATRVRAMLDGDDIEGAFRLVHGVKGTAGNLGATDLFKAAETFHAALKAGKRDTFPPLFDVFQQRLSCALAIIDKLDPIVDLGDLGDLVDSGVSGASCLDAEQKRTLLSECLQLADLLNARNMKALRFADTLKGTLRGEGFGPEVQALEIALTSLDFKTGCVGVREISQKLQEKFNIEL